MATKTDPNLTPAVSPPAGIKPNFVDPPRKDWIFISCCIVVIGVSTPWVLMRMYTRKFIKPSIWWDDITCFLGWAFMVTLSALLINVHQWGGGKDLWNISKKEFGLFKKVGSLASLSLFCLCTPFIPCMRVSTLADPSPIRQHFRDTQIIARVGMCCTKISFLLFYQRLLIPKGTRYTRIWWAIWLCFWYNILYAISLVITVITSCVGKADKVARGAQCVNEYAVLTGASVINASSDLMILAIPIASIWGLQMPAGKKWRLSAVFFFGTLAVLSSIARLAFQLAVRKDKNQSIDTMILSLLNLAEQFIGVIVSCMPILPAFYRHVRTIGTTRDRSNTSSGGLSASIMGFQKRSKASTDRSKSSGRGPKDPFPISDAGTLTTRGLEEGYHELKEVTPGAKPHVSGSELKDEEPPAPVEPERPKESWPLPG